MTRVRNKRCFGNKFRIISFTKLIVIWTGIFAVLYTSCNKEEHKEKLIAVAGNDTIVLDKLEVNLSADRPKRGEGTWAITNGAEGTIANIHDPNTKFIGKYCEYYLLSWIVADGNENIKDFVSVKFKRSFSTYAGADTTINTNEITLKAQPPVYGTKGKWTLLEGSKGVFINDTLYNTKFRVKTCGSFKLQWAISDSCSSAIDDVVITVPYQQTIIADAGADIRSELGVARFQLTGNNPGSGIGYWRVVSGPKGVFTDSTKFNSIFEAEPDTSYILRWTIKGLCDSTYDDIKISIISPKDIDGNAYRVAVIGNQVWFADNLRTTHYNNGDVIPRLTTENRYTWGQVEPRYQWPIFYPPDLFYTWYVISDSRNVCPTGWHVSTDYDWKVLIANLGGYSIAGGKLKEAGTKNWRSPNVGATNETNFTAKPEGYSNDFHSTNGFFNAEAYFWTPSEKDITQAIGYKMRNDSTNVSSVTMGKFNGLPVRCVKD